MHAGRNNPQVRILRAALTVLCALLPALPALAATGPALVADTFSLYSEDVDSVQFGQDGIADLVLRPKPRNLMIGVEAPVFVPRPTELPALVLCGRADGTYQECQPNSWYVPTYATIASTHVEKVGDFDGDGYTDIFLLATASTRDSMIVGADDGVAHLRERFRRVMGIQVSGVASSGVTVSSSYGMSGRSELVINGTAYVEMTASGPVAASTSSTNPLATFFYGLVFSGEPLSTTQPQATTSDEETPAGINAGADGRLVLDLPFQLPAWRDGLTPQLGIRVASGNAVGEAGVGGALAGLSAIARCNDPRAINGAAAAPVTFANTDRLCLDGEFLLPVNNSVNLAAGAEYRPWRSGRTRIVQAGSGATATFTVYREDGLVAEYAQAELLAGEASLPYRWLITRLRDRYNNAVVYEYRSNAVHTGISVIRYQAGATAGDVEIHFRWADNPDYLIAFTAGATGAVPAVLTGIEYHYQGQELLSLELGYQTTSGRPFLKYAQRCARGGLQCAQPVKLTWSATGNGPYVPTVNTISFDPADNTKAAAFGGNPTAARLRNKVGAVVFNALQNRLGYLEGGFGGTSSVYGSFTAITGSQGASSTVYLENDYKSNLMAIDVDLDGYDELVFLSIRRTGDTSSGAPTRFAWLYYDNDDSRIRELASWAPTGNTAIDNLYVNSNGPVPVVADFTGDGKPDFILPVGDYWRLYQNNATAPGAALSLAANSIATLASTTRTVSHLHAIDVEGDGKAELAYRNMSLGTWVVMTAPFTSSATTSLSLDIYNSVWADLNGDGISDLLGQKKYSGEADAILTVWYGMGKVNRYSMHRFEGITVKSMLGESPTYSFYARDETAPFRVLDINNDGRRDIVHVYCTGYNSSNGQCASFTLKYRLQTTGSTLGSAMSTGVTLAGSSADAFNGSGIFYGVTSSILASIIAGRWTVGDYDGDGSPDFVGMAGGTFPSFIAAKGPVARESLPTRVEYGHGRIADVTARTWWDHQYSPALEPAEVLAFPRVTLAPSRDVMTKIRYQDGAGVVREDSYTYGVPHYRVDGAGFLGFQSVTRDRAWFNGATVRPDRELTTTTFEVSAPAYAGRPRSIEERVAGKQVSQTEFYWATVSQVPQVAEAYLQEKRVQVYEPVAGGATPTPLRASYYRADTIDAFGYPQFEIQREGLSEQVGANRGQPATLATTYLRSINTSRSYYNFTSTWLLGLEYETSVSTLVPGRTTVVRGETRGFDSTRGSLQWVERESYADSAYRENWAYTTAGNPRMYSRDWGTYVDASQDEDYLDYDPRGYQRPNRVDRHDAPYNDHLQQVYRNWDRGMDLLKFETQPSGLHHAYEYDFLGRLTKTRQLSFSEEDVYIDTVVDRVKCSTPCGGTAEAVRYVRTTGADGREITEYFDARGNRVERSETVWPGKVASVYTAYDHKGRRIRESVPVIGAMPATSASGTWNTWVWDNYGRLVSSTTPDGVGTALAYTLAGGVLQTESTLTRPLAAGGSSVEVSGQWVDALGNVTKTRDAAGTYTAYTHDNYGSVIATRVNVNADGTDIAATAESAGTVTYTTTYNGQGRWTTRVDPNYGTVTVNYRDGSGEPRQVTRADGTIVHTRRDGFGRVWIESVRSDFMTDRIVTTYHYGTDSAGRTCKGDQLCEVEVVNEGVTSRQRYYYGARGDLQAREETVDGVTYAFQYVYDGLNRLGQAGFPNGVNLEYAYNSVGVMASATYAETVGGVRRSAWTVLDVDARGLPLQESRLGGVLSLSGSWSPDTGLPLTQTAEAGPNVFAQAYTYDGGARLATRSLARNGTSLAAESFGYDALSRLTTQNGATTHAYDALGNIRWQTGLGHYRYQPARPNAVSERVDDEGAVLATYTYNAIGQRLQGDGVTTTHTRDEKPATIVSGATSRTYLYGAGHDWQKELATVGGETVERIQLQDGVWKRAKLGNTYKEYVDLGRGLYHVHEYALDGNGGTLYEINKTVAHVTDLLGSTVASFDANGNTVSDRYYTAFGDERQADGSPTPAPATAVQLFDDDILRGYTGHHQVADARVVHMGGRAYDSRLGQFLSADPAYQSPYFSQSWNRYSYVLNEPFSHTDPSGFLTYDVDEQSYFLDAGDTFPEIAGSFGLDESLLRGMNPQFFSLDGNGQLVFNKQFAEGSEIFLPQNQSTSILSIAASMLGDMRFAKSGVFNGYGADIPKCNIWVANVLWKYSGNYPHTSGSEMVPASAEAWYEASVKGMQPLNGAAPRVGDIIAWDFFDIGFGIPQLGWSAASGHVGIYTGDVRIRDAHGVLHLPLGGGGIINASTVNGVVYRSFDYMNSPLGYPIGDAAFTRYVK